MSRIPRPARLPLLVVLPLAVVLALGVALLVRGGTTDASTVAREAFGAGKPVRSGVADLRLRVDVPGAQGVQGPVSARLRGPFQSRGSRAPAFDFDVDATLPGQALRLGALSTGDRGFLKLDGRAFELSPGLFRQAQADRERSGTQQAPSLRSLGIDPLRWLRDPQVVGSADEGGVETNHVRGRVDVARFTGDLDRLLRRTAELGARAGRQQGAQVPRGLTAQQQQLLRGAVRGATLDFWAGEEDKLLRRVLLKVDLDTSALGGQGTGSAALDLRVSDLNEPQRVQAPRSSVPLAELQEQLRSQAGGGSPGSGAGGSGTRGPGSSGAGSGAQGSGGGTAQADYERCVQRAGSDVDALRRCLAG